MSIATHSVAPEIESGSIYNRVFWLSYAANVSAVAANALTFRFAEFVKYLGGTEHVTGTIVSAGLVAALVVRLRLGVEIDRFGTAKLWATSAVLFMLACVLLLMTSELSWQIYAARIGFSVGLAGMFTCSMVFIQDQAPPQRRTEVIATLGTSGFIGMILGTLLGDLIFVSTAAGRLPFLLLFGGALLLGGTYLVLIVSVTRGDGHHQPRETPPIQRLIVRYWPGMVTLVAMMIGVSVTVTTVFLTRFSTTKGLNGIGVFFAGYCVSAFVFRFASRNWSRTIGRHRMILAGLAGNSLGHCLLPWVSAQWHFVAPSLACGFGHALLFPAVVSLGAGVFPRKYRGTGTTLVLGFTEVGIVIFAPLLGWIIDHYGFPAMFYTSAGLSALVGVAYALTAGRRFDNDTQHNESEGSSIILHRQLVELHDPTADADDDDDEVDEHDRRRGTDSIVAPFPHVGRT